MKKVLVLCEGQTEETFVNRVLNPHLFSLDIYVIPIIVHTRKADNGKKYKGGDPKFPRVLKQIKDLLKDTSAHIVTTMFDFYQLPEDFPGFNSLPNSDCYKQVEYLEQKLMEVIDDKRFFPYVQLHEFEALVFVSPEEIIKVFPEQNEEGKSSKLISLKEILDSYRNPEEINTGILTAPSKRLLSLFPSYEKIHHGSLITGRIGVDQLRLTCPHFDSWLKILERV